MTIRQRWAPLHGSRYVIELIFAADGTVARIVLLPEALLHSHTWTDVPGTVELSPGEMQWLVASANVLRPLGDAHAINHAPNLCFVSGKNLYCADHYELATVNHYHEQLVRNQSAENRLRHIEVLYKQPVAGVVQDVRVQGSERHLRVDGQWYHGEKPGVEIFEKAQVGSVVHLITYGCTPNEKACIAVPEPSNSAAAEQYVNEKLTGHECSGDFSTTTTAEKWRGVP
jgi:hypothetical protein